MMFDPITIANYFIMKSISQGKPITPMKVLKLVYISHGWHLGLTGKSLITEQVEAWKYGPVIRSVYHTYKSFGNDDINRAIFPSQEYKQEYEELSQDAELNLFLDKIWEVYGNYDGLVLSELTHEINTPWHETWNIHGGSLKSGAIIPNDSIMTHYKNKAGSSIDKN